MSRSVRSPRQRWHRANRTQRRSPPPSRPRRGTLALADTGASRATFPAVIRAILHLLNDQPLLVDLLEEPKPGDLTVVCTNVKTVDGKRPVFIDFSSST